METVLNLPVDLNERRQFLESELKKVVIELVENELKEHLSKINREQNLGIESVSWDFQGEYDDEGGTDYYPSDIHISMSDERDPEEITLKVKSKYSDTYYDYSLYEIISETLNDYSDDLYKYDIDEILL